MANDRLIIRCKNCGEEDLLAKYYPPRPPYSVDGVINPLDPPLVQSHWAEDVSDFVQNHMMHSRFYGGGNLGGDSCFEIIAESSAKEHEHG